MLRRYGDELRQSLAEPHGEVSVHVDGEGLVAFLQTTDGEVLQRAHVLPKVHPPNLANTQAAHRDETCREDREDREDIVMLTIRRT